MSLVTAEEQELHMRNVLSYMEEEGLSSCKKKRNKLLGMSPHSFAVLKLNHTIAKHCQVCCLS